jgi:hypothetical protein
MKKIFIVFIIVICLLIFVGTTCLAEKTITPGEFWNRLVNLDRNGNKISEIIKKTYIKGIGEGIFITSAIIDLSTIDNEGKIFDQVYFILEHNEEIMRIMDNLYKDPANVNIRLNWMCIIACDKLKGEDVESLIQDARMLGLLPGF